MATPSSRQVLLILRWSLKDIDDMQAMISRHMDVRSIAEAFLTTPEEIIAVCVRNRLPLPHKQGA